MNLVCLCHAVNIRQFNRRLQRGRMASVKDGKYVANKAPYGYNRIRIENDKGWTLEINKEEADGCPIDF